MPFISIFDIISLVEALIKLRAPIIRGALNFIKKESIDHNWYRTAS